MESVLQPRIILLEIELLGMCGRTSLFVEQGKLEDRFGAKIVTDGGYVPRYNIAPGEPLEIITNEAPDVIDQFHWGLIPFWEDTPVEGIINARSETAAEKNVFKDAWETRPCLVLSSGFYEWKSANGGPKEPYRIYREEDPAFAMAGLWEVWEDDEGNSIPCVTILTTEPNDVVESIHDRMPVILPRSHEDVWLEADPSERNEFCQPYSRDDLDAYPVSTAVNDPANDHSQIIEPADTTQSDFSEFA